MSRTLSPRSYVIALAGLLWLLPMAGCSGRQASEQPTQQGSVELEEPEEAVQTESEEPEDAGQGEQAIDPAPEPEAVAGTPATSVPVEKPQPSPPTKPETPAPSTAPSPPSSTQVEVPPPPSEEVAEPAPVPPAKIVAVPATKPGITRVGAEKCRLCHKVQYASWATMAHASRTPLLECESCHGPGSEYKTIAIMKDPEKARAAGLVIPEKTFCTENGHASEWQDDMIERVHAHKVKAAGG